MDKQFSLIISSSGNNMYSINFRCWIFNQDGQQETIAVLVDFNKSLDDALAEQTSFINTNK
jgi:hypothetical protein